MRCSFTSPSEVCHSRQNLRHRDDQEDLNRDGVRLLSFDQLSPVSANWNSMVASTFWAKRRKSIRAPQNEYAQKLSWFHWNMGHWNVMGHGTQHERFWRYKKNGWFGPWPCIGSKSHVDSYRDDYVSHVEGPQDRQNSKELNLSLTWCHIIEIVSSFRDGRKYCGFIQRYPVSC